MVKSYSWTGNGNSKLQVVVLVLLNDQMQFVVTKKMKIFSIVQTDEQEEYEYRSN